MANITIELLRKRCEHNEGEIGTLEELSLHQEDLIKIEHLQNWCKGLKILLLQSNLIFKIENLNKLKQLEYLNLALNCVEKIENLDRCESLNKLDLTMNFIGELTSVETLKNNIHLRTLFLTGNPCTDYDGYRQYVIGTLPQLDTLDGEEITHYDKLVAKQILQDIKQKIIIQQSEYIRRQEEKRKSSNKNPLKIIEENLTTEVDENADKDFWNKPSENTPECRVEMAMHTRRAQRRKESKETAKEVKWQPKLFRDNGRPYNINQAKVGYDMENEADQYILTVQVYKYLDTSELDVDVQPNYVRVTIRKKILQLVLDEEVKTDESSAKRLVGSKLLEITMPKAKPIIRPNQNKCKNIGKVVNNISKTVLLDDMKDNKKPIEFWNIVDEKKTTNKFQNANVLEDFIDNSEVPPLE
ncbi:protein tilB-like [Adelges cooleyi]|uniref:protein tilB-like n=1 Tax=Adelges cooleyi TaxID=133065 RepID=UPI00217F9272|nr:protein tilB-like [Adelges cooleyi]